jgi:4-carboxymuconolactone decarboxylase
MNDRTIQDTFDRILAAFRPTRFAPSRALALYSAAITLSTEDQLIGAARMCTAHGVAREQLYETVLQSYLFLGFPRMLFAAQCLQTLYPQAPASGNVALVAPISPERWLERGQELCRRVYDGNYEALKARVETMAPEIFLWMELEGYGKVLSRPGLDVINRELAIVAVLTVENRRAQLHSHLRGALNVGAAPEVLLDVLDDLHPIAPDGYATAHELLPRLGVKE